MLDYYSQHLNANNLEACYEAAPPRVKRFLEAEIKLVLAQIRPGDRVLDLGCGYGRVAVRLAARAGRVTGIDLSQDNIAYGILKYGHIPGLEFLVMDAADLAFRDGAFDVTICVQNGISAFKTDPHKLMGEAIRVTRKGGLILFSSYSEKFWEDRLNWFRIQSELGLIGEIDDRQTKDGVIVCKDGFRAVTWSPEAFLELASEFPVRATIREVDDSSVFCWLDA